MDQMLSPRDVFTDALREGGGLHSPLYRWLYKHHDVVALERARHQVTWDALARQLALRGVGHRDGGKASAASLRVTWSRVRRAVLRDRTREGGQSRDADPAEHHPVIPRAASGSAYEAGVMMPAPDNPGVTADVPDACAGPGLVPGVTELSTAGSGGDDSAPPGRSPEGEEGSTPGKKRRLMW